MLIVTGIIYLLNKYALKSMENDMIILISILIAGTGFAFYFFKKRAKSLFVLYMFLVGSVMFVNSVDYAFNNLLKPHQKERVDIILGIENRSARDGI